MADKNVVALTAWVKPAERDRVRIVAAVQGQSMSAWVGEVIREALERRDSDSSDQSLSA